MVLFCWGRQKREGFVFLRVTEQEILKETYTKPHTVIFFLIIFFFSFLGLNGTLEGKSNFYILKGCFYNEAWMVTVTRTISRALSCSATALFVMLLAHWFCTERETRKGVGSPPQACKKESQRRTYLRVKGTCINIIIRKKTWPMDWKNRHIYTLDGRETPMLKQIAKLL